MLGARRTAKSPTIRLLAASAAAFALLAAGAPQAGAAAPGTPDPSFGSAGVAGGGQNIRLFGTAAQSDGKVVGVGENSAATLVVERFTSSGGLDSSFGSGGVATGPPVAGGFAPNSLGRAVAVQSDGKIVVVGKATNSDGSGRFGLIVERFNANGGIDSTFGNHGLVTVLNGSFGDGYAVALQSDGKIVATGTSDTAGAGGVAPRVAVVRLNSNGSLDGSFAGGGVDVIDLGAYSYALGAAVQTDGKIVVAGSQAPGLQVPNALIARLTTSGTLDHTFAGSGAYAHQYSPAGAANSSFNSVAVQSDGKIVAGGATVVGAGAADAIVTRFTSSGAPDGSFGSGGVVYTPSSISAPSGTTVPGINGLAVAPNGDIVTAGVVVSGLVQRAALWAFTPGGSLDGRFGSGGRVSTGFGSFVDDEFGGIALAPSGSIIAVGDAQPSYGGTFSAIAARYVGFGAVVPPPPPALSASFTGVKGSDKTSSIASKGLKIALKCNQACSVKATLTLSSSTAKKLHIKSTIQKCTKVHGKKKCKKTSGYATVTIASTNSSFRSGTGTITLKLNKKYVKTLEKQRSVSVALKASITSTATHKSKTISKGLTFKR